MYKILEAKELTSNIFSMVVEAKRVAKACEPGQFVIVRTNGESERIPLTICDYDREKGTVTIVFQAVGAGTEIMAHLKEGDFFHDFVGPLGCPSDLVKEEISELKKKKILFVAGGVGTAPVYPQVKWLHERGVEADVIVGAKTKELLILEEEMNAVAGNLYVTTDDGSYGDTDHQRSCGRREGLRFMYRHRPHDHDEICVQAHKGTEYSNGCQSQSHHGGRYGNVRSLQSHRRRKGKICLCGRTGI